MTNRLHLKLESQLSSLHELEAAIEEFGSAHEWPPDLLFRVQLSLEELVANVINHGYGESGHKFEVTIASTEEALTIELTDSARPFNPLADAPEATVDAALEDRPIGGLGVHLVRTMMDEMRYERDGGKNRLTLVKRRGE